MPTSDQLSQPSTGKLGVAVQPTGGQGLALDPDGTINPKLLKGFPNDATKSLLGDGSWGVTSPLTVKKTTTTVTWNTSAAVSSDLLSNAAASLTLTSSSLMRITLFLDTLNFSGGAATFTYSVYLGGTQIIALPAISMANSVNRQIMEVQFTVMNTATAAQVVKGLVFYPGTVSGTSDLFNGTPGLSAKYATATVNTASAVTLQAAVQHSTASASQETKLLAGSVEII